MVGRLRFALGYTLSTNRNMQRIFFLRGVKGSGQRCACFPLRLESRAEIRCPQAILVLASGGVFTEGEWASWDFVEPYLRGILSFIGIYDVQTVRAEGMNIPPLAEHAMSNGEKAVERLSL
jgi:Flavodoxin-like fold